MSSSTSVIRGNSLYKVVYGTWEESQATSISLGGHLATINTEEENRFIVNSVLKDDVIYNSVKGDLSGNNSTVPRAWIGLNDIKNEGTYEWISGEPVTFRGTIDSHFTGENYTYGRFDPVSGLVDDSLPLINAYINQDATAIQLTNSKDSNGAWNSFWTAGSWEDTWYNYSRMESGIAEIPFIRRGDSAYVIVEGPTWEEAEANAIALGGHLVTINDAAENEWITNTLLAGRGGQDLELEAFYIGITDQDQEGQWKWISGESSSYTNWYWDNPNGAGDENYGEIYSENTGWVEYTGGLENMGKWNDSPNNNGRSYGIAEIPLAPNNTPTGTPTLTGDFKVGKTISIDASDIEDVDNFEGWTPTYEYSWEVSGDNGTTWNALTSSDSTDDDNNYTLTSAEAGKQLRGLVSYLDGYGTFESIVSAAEEIPLETNHAPTALTVTSSNIDENVDDGSVVATLSSIDPDAGDTHTYELVEGDGDADNSAFIVQGDQLKIVGSPDFEIKSSYSIRLQTQDYHRLTFEKSFKFSVNDINEAPSALKISSRSFDENIADDSAVASFSTVDQDFGDAHVYSLVPGRGDADNSAFIIDGNRLLINSSPDFETQSSYSIRLQTMDSSGLTYAESFKLLVNDLPEPIDKLELLEATIDGDVLTLDFNKPLDSESTPSLDFWTVKEDGKKVLITSIKQRASVAKILLTLDQPVDRKSEVTLSYRDLVGDQLSDVVQDSDGYDLDSINDWVVENQTERATTELGVLFAEVDGNKVLVAFNRELDDTSPSLAPFRFKANGRKVPIDNAVLDPDGRQLALTLSRFIRFDETATLMYTDAEGDQRDGVVQDIDGNDLVSFNMDVENASPQESKLELVSGEAEDGLITLDFNEQLSGTKLSKKRFKVKVNNKKAKVDSAEIFSEDGCIKININKNIEFGDDVLISYKDLNGDQADGVIQDGYGSDLATFKNFAPDVTASDEQGPTLEEAYIDDGQLYLEFDEIIAPGKVKRSRIKLRADGKRMKVKGITIEDEDTVAVFELKKQLSPITQELLLSYKDPKRDQRSGVIQDLIGNDMESVQNIAVEIVGL